MNEYRVGFWWNTDLRAEVVVDAKSAGLAVILASSSSLITWVEEGKNFKITVQLT